MSHFSIGISLIGSIRKRKYQEDEAETNNNPFAERYKDDEDKQDNQTEKKRKTRARKGSFNSKTRFKRRK